MKNILIFLMLVFVFSSVNAQTVNIVLKNNTVITGNVVQEAPEFILLSNDIGEIKLNRQNIESITYTQNEPENEIVNPTSNFSKNKSVLNDLVLIYLKDGDVVSGKLIAKSLDVILVKTESGNLTIPKRELLKIEYLSKEFSERGEVVIAHLSNGNKFEGNIYYEDNQNLILDTKIGRLTIDKNNLRTVEYTGETGKGEDTLERFSVKEEDTTKTIRKSIDAVVNTPKVQRHLEPRLDIISAGYSPSFGADYKTGFGIGYASKFLLSEMDGFYISALGGLNLNYFALNSSAFTDEPIPVSASGGVFLTTVSAGASFTLLQQSASQYEFYIAPQLEANIVYKNLTKSFPSYPFFNSKVAETKFIFGIGNKIGIDMLFEGMKIGLSYDSHFLFGDEDYNMISINFTKKFF